MTDITTRRDALERDAAIAQEELGAAATAGKGKRRIALGLAALVFVAGAAGAVATTTAYFNDEKFVQTNTVSANTIVLGLFDGDTSTTSLTNFSLSNLAPASTADLDANKPSMKVFTVKNTGTANFTWSGDIDQLSLTKTDGSTLVSPTSTDAQTKIYVQFGTPTIVSGAVTSVVWEAARTLTLSQVTATKEIAVTTLASGASSTKVVRFYMDPTAGNDYQNVKVSYTLRLNAEQIH